jgi:hypothetical protein
MPLREGKSKQAFSHNVEAEMHAGKPQKQALAIAYAMKKKHAGMAKGGMAMPPSDPRLQSDAKMCDMCGGPHSNEEHESDRHDSAGEPMMAEGGQIRDNYQSPSTAMHQTRDGSVDPQDAYAPMHEGNVQRPSSMAVSEDDRRLNQHRHEENQGDMNTEFPLVEKIMMGRAKGYSEGGRVANEDHGPMDSRLAGFDQNEFDDLSLRDDLEFSYTGKTSGDEKGDAQEDEDRKDIVSRIMKSRAKKDRMPNPA